LIIPAMPAACRIVGNALSPDWFVAANLSFFKDFGLFRILAIDLL
jgi:hypothetical protein